MTSNYDLMLDQCQKEAIPWETLFPDQHFPTNDRRFCSAENGRYLLSRMLVIDHERRISVEEALKQSYVSWKNSVDELSGPPRGEYDRNVELETSSINEWKRLIFERIKDYEKINMKQTQK